MAAETRPADSTPFTYHWLASGRAEGRPSSEDVVPALWVAEGWHSFAEVPTITPAEMYRRGWRYHGPVAFPLGLDDAPDLPPPPPTMSAEDVAIIAAAETQEAAWKAWRTCFGYEREEKARLLIAYEDACEVTTAAVRSRAAKQEVKVETPKFKVGDRVRYTVEGSWAHGKVATITRADIDAALMRFDGHGEAYALFSEIVLASNPDPSLHADGDDREAEVVDRADEEGRRVAGLRDAVVEEALAADDTDDPEMMEARMPALWRATESLRAALTPPAAVDPVARIENLIGSLVELKSDGDKSADIDWIVAELNAALAALARTPNPVAELDAAVVDVLTVVDMSVRANAEKVARVSRARAAMAREAKP